MAALVKTVYGHESRACGSGNDLSNRSRLVTGAPGTIARGLFPFAAVDMYTRYRYHRIHKKKNINATEIKQTAPFVWLPSRESVSKLALLPADVAALVPKLSYNAPKIQQFVCSGLRSLQRKKNRFFSDL